MGTGNYRRNNSGGRCDLDFDRFGSDLRPVRNYFCAGERLGRWVGPIGGTLCSFLAAFFVARPLTSGRITNGVAVGFFLAVLDVVLLVASQAPFQWLFVVSNLGKILAGYIGGVASSRFGKDTQKLA